MDPSQGRGVGTIVPLTLLRIVQMALAAARMAVYPPLIDELLFISEM